MCCGLRPSRLILLRVLVLIGLVGSIAGAAEHPFMLWTKDDLATIRKRIETEPWAKATWTRMTEGEGNERCLGGLLRYAVLADREAGAKEKKELLRVLKSPIPRGGAQWITILRYDLLYDELSEEERKAFAEMAHVYIRNAVFENAVFNPKIFNDSRNYSRYDAREYTRTNWLPNITWPRKVSANLMAVALRDEALIRKVWAAYGSWKWYFDEYLCDIGFYSEEFSKMGSTPGAMLVYCIALERLGLGDLGFGYKGKGGATMRGHIESLIHLGYPRVDLGSSRPHYPMVTMGDLRQSGSSQAYNMPSPAFQHGLVMGYLDDGPGGNIRWRAHGAWGGTVRGNHAQWDGYSGFTPKMQIPLWFELGHKRWPDAGFGYFLAQMRAPDEDRYIPSLLFGIEPVDPATAKPPKALSAVWPDRGLVMLRAEESSTYWESPAPAVCMRLASNYAHNVNDAFALLGFYAFNRPIYLNRQSYPGYAQGWSRSIQSHCGIVVDGKEPKFTSAVAVRHAFLPEVKFVAARSREVYEGVELSRWLVLTREYLLDVSEVAGEKPHRVQWLVHALGEAQAADGLSLAPGRLPEGLQELPSVRSASTDQTWSLEILQTCAAPPAKAELPKSWYDRQVGVHLWMAGAKDTQVCIAKTPPRLRTYRDESKKSVTEEVPCEVGGVTVVVGREAPVTRFMACHAPFENGRLVVEVAHVLVESADGLAVGVSSPRFSDYVLIGLDEEPGKVLSLQVGDLEFSFSGFAHVRTADERVEVSGSMHGMRLQVRGRPRLVVNGQDVQPEFQGGILTYKAQ